MKLNYYIKNYALQFLPSKMHKKRYQSLKEYEERVDPQVIADRLSYYIKLTQNFKLADTAISIKNFKKSVGTGYYLDLKKFLYHFEKDLKIQYRFGDDKTIPSSPTLLKARKICPHNDHAILFKLNKLRHFIWVDDDVPYRSKKDQLVFRGAAYQPLRKDFVQKYHDHHRMNVGQTNKPSESVPWQKQPMSIKTQLDYKFIVALEGNDVASGLKWMMSSNSLCFMPTPTCETWYMEGRLQPHVHYVPIKSDFSDLEEKMDYYLSAPDKAEAIIHHAQQWTQQFRDDKLEDLLCLKVLERYVELSGQGVIICT